MTRVLSSVILPPGQSFALYSILYHNNYCNRCPYGILSLYGIIIQVDSILMFHMSGQSSIITLLNAYMSKNLDMQQFHH